MIKVTIPEKKQSLDFPMLMITKDGLIILAYHLETVTGYLWGTVISTVITMGHSHGVGYHSTTWDFGSFKPYTGTITLENQETA